LRAANHGSIVALNVLGIFYEQGFAVNQDPAEAIKWYTKAAHCGHPHAQYNLARCYHDGFGVPHNDALALKWFEAAANQRHALSQLSSAVCYEYGIGTGVQFHKAYHYYIEAAKNGSEPARKRLRPVIATDILRITRAYVNSHTLPIEPHVYRTDSKFFEDEKLVASLHQASLLDDQLETMRLQMCLKTLPIELFFKILLHLDTVKALRPSQILNIYDMAVQSRRFNSVTEFTEALGVTEVKVRCINADKNLTCKHVGHIVSMLQVLE
jgi:TPR repeat protein